ncbi:MAG: non-canonical purine NTP pyrophosphatase [Acidobacteriota bacterium]|nr:non-canonical purine NTP pyrophosphatase [Acidobacteriota bacterium]
MRMMPGWRLDALPGEVELPPEDGATFAEIALTKARAVAAATGRPSLGEDSGLEAEALGGAPGIHSARFAADGEGNATDEENLAKLRREAPAGSALRYVCALAYVDPGRGRERVFRGTCEGLLADEPRGDGGFGYDPVFLADLAPNGLTMAQLADEQKDAISHRGEAVRALRAWLEAER